MKHRPIKRPTICLNMIVKDEEHIIIRCLESIKDVIDYWVISDTGSTDRTKQIITEFFNTHNIPGELHEHAWKNFSYNRNVALEHAKGKADYILMMDADDQLIHNKHFRFKNLIAGGYDINCKLNDIYYARRQLIKASLPWKWVGVIHEYLECNISCSTALYPESYIIASTEGARGKNPDRFKNDIKILKAGLREEPDNTRYQFYLAQSYRDDSNFPQAIIEYQKRVDMGGWEEEIYYSLFEIGNCQSKLNVKQSIVLESFLKAYHYRTSRLEALHQAIVVCRLSEKYHLGYHLGRHAIHTPVSKDILFVDTHIHQWKLKDEVSVCASWIGRKSESKKLINDILKINHLSESTRKRLEENLGFC